MLNYTEIFTVQCNVMDSDENPYFVTDFKFYTSGLGTNEFLHIIGLAFEISSKECSQTSFRSIIFRSGRHPYLADRRWSCIDWHAISELIWEAYHDLTTPSLGRSRNYSATTHSARSPLNSLQSYFIELFRCSGVVLRHYIVF